jgi:ATP-dependent DNA helicase RecQ
MPTGGGKSLCYQLPALLRPGLTVVVSPLIALMKDQVDALQALGVEATYINSSLDQTEIGRRQGAVARGDVRLLYVAPERLMLPGFLRLLATVPLSHFAIDEAHCISEWGHDFRPEYRELRRLRELFPRTPLGAFTATATRRVQADIVDQLGLKGAASFRGSFNRPNLFYDVRAKQNAYGQLVDYLREHRDESGIIYCFSRANTDALAERLQKDGFAAAAYHAGLDGDERHRRQDQFIRDDVRIIVATIAFGMGIDKPDVRFVVHYDLPKNLEGYYQESGRAGRDGEPADCILFYSYGDAAKHEHFIDEKPTALERRVAREQLKRIIDWAANYECRRRGLLAYFDELFEGQEGPCCDVCRSPVEEEDWTVPAQMFLSCVKRTGERFGVAHVIDVLRGSRGEKVLRMGHDRLSTYGIGKDHTKEEWYHLARELLRGGYARQAPEDFNAVKVTERGYAVFRGETVTIAGLPRPKAVEAEEPVGNADLFEELRALRKQLADERGVPPYVIFPDAVLRQMATALPTTRASLLAIPGVGNYKARQFGDAFLARIAPHAPPPPEEPAEAEDVPAPVRLPKPPKPPRRQPGELSDTVVETLALFEQGQSPAEIAATRQKTLDTIEDHLAAAIEAGKPIDLDRLVDPAKRASIEAAIAAVGAERLKPIMEYLGEGYTYGELRLVRAALSRRNAE